jgi:hypothetical protein
MLFIFHHNFGFFFLFKKKKIFKKQKKDKNMRGNNAKKQGNAAAAAASKKEETAPSIMSKDIVPEAESHSFQRLPDTPKGLLYCMQCKMNVKPEYEYGWCGTEPFAYCPADPNLPSKKKLRQRPIPENELASSVDVKF